MFGSKYISAKVEGDFAVFLIGARVNAWWKVHRWLPVARAMPRMLRELNEHPDLGMLGCESFFGRTSCLVQYWRSKEHLLTYARSKDSEHLPAWRHFNRMVRGHGAIGIWHEIYTVQAGSYSNLYHDMPRFGLGRVGTTEELRRG